MTAATARRRIPAVALWGALGVLAWALFAVLLGGSNAHAAESGEAHARSTTVAQGGHAGPGKGRGPSQDDQGHRASGDRPSSPSWTKPPVTKPPVSDPHTSKPQTPGPGVQKPKPQKPAPQPPKTHRPVVPDVQDMLRKVEEAASDAERKAADAVHGRDDDRGRGARPGAWVLRPGDRPGARADQGRDDHRGPRVGIGENPRFGDQQARSDHARSGAHPERASAKRAAPAASWTAPVVHAALPAPAVVTPTPPDAVPPPEPDLDATGFSPMTPKPATPTTSAGGGLVLSALATVGEADPLDAPSSAGAPSEATGISPPAAPVATADVSPD